MPQVVVLAGPIAAGKNTVAAALSWLLIECGRTVVVAATLGPGLASPLLRNAHVHGRIPPWSIRGARRRGCARSSGQRNAAPRP
jgi:hypothetical protein